MDLIRKISIWYVLATPIIAGLSTLDFQIGGMNYTGFIWAVMLPMGLYLLVVNRMSGAAAGGIFPAWPWLAWCGLVCLSLLWCDEFTLRNVQDALQLCMPVVVGLLAASVIRTHAQLRALFAAFGIALGLLAMYTTVYVMNIFDKEWISTNMRGAAMTATLAGCVFLAAFPGRKLLPLLGWAACLLITTLTSSRIATLGLLAAPIIHPYVRGNLLWKGLAASVTVGLSLMLFNTQTFQQHFFASGKGTLGDLFTGDYNDFGRYEAWTETWEEAWRHPLQGAGVGSVYSFVPKVWYEMNHIHNDYLRVFYELGLVGVATFVAVSVWQLLNLRRQIATTSGIVRTTFIAAWLGYIAMLISCLTDNTLVYTVLFTDPLFVLMGAAYGAAWAECQENTAATISETADARQLVVHPRLRKFDRAAIGPVRARGLLGHWPN